MSKVEVDELALMLDGTSDQLTGIRLVGHVEHLVARRGYMNRPPLLERRLKTETDVAQAILELEGHASNAWSFGPLALQAWHRARRRATCGERIIIISLEAAALLRDGWRPRGWR